MSRVFIVRHGETEWNALGLLQGAVDVPLSDVGRAQAREAAAVLARLVDSSPVVVSSSLSRARETAQVFADAVGVDVHVDDRLRERAYGVWEGITAQERLEKWPEAVERWHEHGNPDVPGFEVHDEVRDRMVAALEEWTGRSSGDVVAFSHGSSGRIGAVGLLGLSLEHRTLGNLGNTSWSCLVRADDGVWGLARHAVSAADVRPS